MFSRKDPEQVGSPITNEWTQKVLELMRSVYSQQCQQQGKDFFIYGETYDKELVAAFSLVDKTDPMSIPVTYFVSFDVEKKEAMNDLLNTVVDSVGVFFDTYFQDQSWNDYQALWQEAIFKKTKFHYKVTRENVELTLEANKILS